MSRTADRIYGIDVVRWFSFYAILVFHLTYAFWAREGDTVLPVHGPWVWPLETYARILGTSGFHVLFLSFFLFGIHGLKSKLPSFLLVFTVIWAVTVEDGLFDWDIYPFLLVACAVIWVLETWRLPAKVIALVSAIGMVLPFWKLESLSRGPNPWIVSLVGYCADAGDLGDWPLLPWIFYVTWAWSLGRLSKDFHIWLSTLRKIEIAVWIALLTGSLPFLGSYYQTPLGESFGCHAFRQPAPVFLGHHLWLLAVLRVSLTANVKQRLKKQRFVQWIANSPVNQRFFLVYFAHYPATFIIAWAARQTGLHHEAWILAASFAIIFVSMEWVWRKANVSSSII